MGVVGCAQFGRPFLHADGHAVGDIATQGLLVVHDVEELIEDIASDILFHLFACEHILCKDHICLFVRFLLKTNFFDKLGYKKTNYCKRRNIYYS